VAETRKFDPEAVLEVLERVAGQSAPGSPEHAAIDLAARALLFVHAGGLDEDFRRYLTIMDEPLGDEERAFLERIGLEP
jgi:hypothetical protein